MQLAKNNEPLQGCLSPLVSGFQRDKRTRSQTENLAKGGVVTVLFFFTPRCPRLLKR